MQPANRQITSLQQTSSNDIYSVSDPDDPRFSLMSPHMQRLQHTMELYLVKPKTRKGQLFCWLFWLGFAASVGLLFWQVLPRFVDHGKLSHVMLTFAVRTWCQHQRSLLFYSCEAYHQLYRGMHVTTRPPAASLLQPVARTVHCRDISPRFKWLPSLWQEWPYFQSSLFHPPLSCYLFQRCWASGGGF